MPDFNDASLDGVGRTAKQEAARMGPDILDAVAEVGHHNLAVDASFAQIACKRPEQGWLVDEYVRIREVGEKAFGLG